MDEETIIHITSNQKIWAEQYNKKKIHELKEYNKKMLHKKYYGNSKEYRQVWEKEGAIYNK